MGSKSRLHFLLNDLQSPINIGQCLRAAETYGIDLHIHDPRKITADADMLRTISDFSCGAWERRAFRGVNGAAAFLRSHPGRVVATCLCPTAVRLPAFRFEPDDMVVFGNEYDGLGPDILDLADEKLYVPMPAACLPKPRSGKPIDPSRTHGVQRNGLPNLNVAVTAGIIAYAHACWAEDAVHARRPSMREPALS
ncbi:MAG: TrmH family RNA methyltransferase [Burkholderiaceae bacterium]